MTFATKRLIGQLLWALIFTLAALTFIWRSGIYDRVQMAFHLTDWQIQADKERAEMELEKERQAHEKELEENETLSTWRVVKTWFWEAFPIILALTSLFAVWRGWWWRRMSEKTLDYAGRGWVARSERPNVPKTQTTTTTYSPTYAPHITYKNQQTGTTQTEQAAQLATLAKVSYETMSAHFGGEHLYFGQDESGELLKLPFKKMKSLLLFGLSDTGKSNTVTLLCRQFATRGVKLLVSDPHGESGEEDALIERLAGLPIEAVSVSENDILKTAQFMAAQLAERKAGKKGPEYIWIIDELLTIPRSNNKILQNTCYVTWEALAQEGRKFGLYCLGIAHNAKASKFGDSSVRDSFPLVLLHRLKKDNARLVLQDSEDAPIVAKLDVGQALFDLGKESRLISVPLVPPLAASTTSQLPLDAQTATSIHPKAASTTSTPTVTVETVKPSKEAGKEVGKEVDISDVDRMRIIEMAREGKGSRQIVVDVFGTSRGNGYIKNCRVVSAVIAQELSKL